MSILDVLIRQQGIAVAVQKQRLHDIRQRHATTEDTLDLQRAQSAATQQHLHELLGNREGLALDALRLTQAHLIAYLNRINQLETELARIGAELTAAEQDAARAQKRLEKLEQLALEERREHREHEHQLAWQALDEWVLNTRRRSA